MSRSDEPVTIVGAGLAGVACAVALTAAGVRVRVLDRGRTPGGRMASPRLHGRAVDLGAGYFTVEDEQFDVVVRRWRANGLARPWTDTFTVLEPGQDPQSKTGPVRWGTSGGLQSLVRDLLASGGVKTAPPVEVGELRQLRDDDSPLVVAMPDPQAGRLLEPASVPGWDPVAYDPVIAVACGYRDRAWTRLRGAAFVNDHPDVAFVADDGARRGDGAPVLVAHSTADLARRHLDDPDAAVAPLVTALGELLGLGRPAWTHVQRWTFAKPAEAHDEPYLLAEVGGRAIGLAGDQWCPDGAPRVESAWLSGTRLAQALLERGTAG